MFDLIHIHGFIRRKEQTIIESTNELREILASREPKEILSALSDVQRAGIAREAFRELDQRKIVNTFVGPQFFLPERENANLRVIRFSDMKEKPVEWLMKPYIPLGKVTIVSGDPGTGKSSFILNIAAKLTAGEKLPFSSEEAEEKKVVYLTTEDGLEDTVLPRFLKAGGKSENLFTIDESLSPIKDFGDQRIADIVRETGASVLVLDPLSSYIGTGTNVNAANQVREQMNSLISIAEEFKIAVIVIAHLNTASGLKAIYRNCGSIDIIGSARSNLLVVQYGKEGSRLRAVFHVKSNLAEKGDAIIYEIRENGTIDFLRKEKIDPNAFLFNEEERSFSEEKRRSAEEAILECLAEFEGKVPSKVIFEKLDEIGVSEKMTRKIKRKHNIISVRENDSWFWTKAPFSGEE